MVTLFHIHLYSDLVSDPPVQQPCFRPTCTVTLFQIHLYGDKLEKLHEQFPPEMLPEDLGGRLPPYSNTVSVAEGACS